MEIYVAVKGYEGLYEVSNYGNVRSVDRKVTSKNGVCTTRKGKPLSKRVTKSKGNRHSRYNYELWKDNIRKVFPAHRLVALNFIPNPLNKPQVNHIDGNPFNNRVDNLEWVDNSENMAHAYANGLAKARGCKAVKATDKQGRTYEFESLEDAARKLNITSNAIRHAVRGRCKTGGGYKWEYL